MQKTAPDVKKKLVELLEKSKGEKPLSAWERVVLSRHPERPHALDYIKSLSTSFAELHGDRLFGDDPAIVTGLAVIGGEKWVVIAQEKGSDTESRIARNFGMPHPEGYRKALRALRLAAKFHLPVLTLIDTMGANPTLASEERGQGWAIANNLAEMARLPTPILVLIIGEGCSGGALGIGVGDRIAMLEHAYYSVISPEGCASILWRDGSKRAEAAEALKLTSEELLKLGIIDAIIPEPPGGAHCDKEATFARVKQYIMEEREKLITLPLKELVEMRYQKFRQMGEFTKT